MKKLLALLCTLCVLSSAAASLAAPGDAFLFTNEQRETMGITNYSAPSMAAIGDTVYTLWGSDIYTWTAGDETPVRAASGLPFGYYSEYADAEAELGSDAEKMITLLVSDGETVFGLNGLNGYLYPLSFADGAAAYGTPAALDWSAISDMAENGDYVEIYKACFVGGTLYLLVRNGNDYYHPVLYAFNPSTGEAQTIEAEFVQDIAPYRDGQLLMEIYDNENAYDSETGQMKKPSLSVYIPADGSLTPVGTFGDSSLTGLAYDEANDTLYYTASSKLMAMPALGDAVQVAFMPLDYTSDSTAVILASGLYAVDTWNGLIVRNTDPAQMPKTSLAVYGGYLDNAANSFIAQYPDVPLTFSQDEYYSDAAALAQAMVSGDTTYDLYYYDLSYQDFTSLMKKGYCMDLSPYADLTNELSKMYPFIQSALAYGGKFYAVPMYLYGNGLSVYTDAWEQAGLTDRIPTSFMGLVEFIRWWLDEGMDEHPDTQLLEYAYDYRSDLFSLAFSLYLSEYQAEGKELTLDTPQFRAMMTALEALDFDQLNDSIPELDENAYGKRTFRDNPSSLFTLYGNWLSVGDYNVNSSPLILPIDDGGAVHLPASISCVFVNPHTANPDLTADFLRCVLKGLDPAQRIMMFPDQNDPVPNEYFQETVDSYEEMLADAKEKLQDAAPEDVKDLQAAIDDYQNFLDHQDQYYWTASAESIAKYRELAGLAYATVPNILSYSSGDASSEVASLISRYQQGQLSLDQFVTQADQKIRMIQLEGQ